MQSASLHVQGPYAGAVRLPLNGPALECGSGAIDEGSRRVRLGCGVLCDCGLFRGLFHGLGFVLGLKGWDLPWGGFIPGCVIVVYTPSCKTAFVCKG